LDTNNNLLLANQPINVSVRPNLLHQQIHPSTQY
jgi:hypothetical protein